MLFGAGPSSRISRLVMPPIRNRARSLALEFLHRAAQRVDGQRPVQPRVEDPVQHVLPGLADLQRLREQVRVVVHDDPVVAQRLGEGVVLGLRLGDPQHVVEQQVGGVVRGQPLQLQVGAVQDDLAQLADLRVDTEHGGLPAVCLPVCYLMPSGPAAEYWRRYPGRTLRWLRTR